MHTNLSFTSLAARLACAGFAAVAVAAHADGTPSATATATGTAGTHAKAGAHGARWVEAGPAKPNGSGVRIRYSVPATLQPGQTATVQLEFSGARIEGARAEWRMPAGVTATSTAGGNASSVALVPGQTTRVSLQVTPSADGMAYLDVFTTQDGRGTAQSIPLAVGSGKVTLQQNGAAKTTPSGEKVISLPSTPK